MNTLTLNISKKHSLGCVSQLFSVILSEFHHQVNLKYLIYNWILMV